MFCWHNNRYVLVFTWGAIMSRPKYCMNHICVEMADGSYGVFHKQRQDEHKIHPSIIATGTPLAKGDSVESAICSAEERGIKHYDIEVVVFDV